METESQEKTTKKFPYLSINHFDALGTKIEIRLMVQDEEDLGRAAECLEEVKRLYGKYEAIFSRFDKRSELSLLNDSLGESREVSADMVRVVSDSLSFHSLTDGLFDPRIIGELERIGYRHDFKKGGFVKETGGLPVGIKREGLDNDINIENSKVLFRTRMDFSGIAKGYITDKIAEYLEREGRSDFMVESGGDMRFKGNDENGNGWVMGIEGIDDEKLMLVLRDKGIATSGISRRKWETEEGRFHHLINPKDPGKFDFSLKSVTVLADTAEEGDIWAKVLFLMGREDGLKYAKEKSISAIFLDSRSNAWVSPATKEFLFQM